MVSGIYTTWTPCSHHTTSQVTGPNILLISVVSVGGTFWLLVPCMRKVHTRPALTWTAGSTIIEFRSHQQALSNLTNAWTPVGLSPITLLSSYFAFQLKSWIHGRVCVPSVSDWRMWQFSMVGGIYTTWTTCSHHNTSQMTGPKILLIRVVSVGGRPWI